MINYSIALRAVNTNLLEINQAKSRIAKAKEAGVAPDPADVTLATTELQTKAYAVAQYSDVMTIEKFAKHISEHGCVYSRADISAILYMAVDCMREQLLDGKKIRLGDLGDFSVSLISKGADTADKFNAGIHITGINVTWDCGQEFKNLITDAEFNLVASRAAQAAVIKAIKSGESVVDLNANPSGDNEQQSTDNSGNTPGGSSSGSNDSSGSTTKRTLTLSADPGIGGTVEGSGEYNDGATANISATANSGYKFVRWSDGNTSANRTVMMSEDKILTAQFQADSQSEGDNSGW